MDIIRDRTSKAMKDFVCDACLRKFAKGTTVRVQTNNYDGIQHFKTCPTCYKLMINYFDYFKNYDNTCEHGFIDEYLDKDQTPEQLLDKLIKLLI